MGSDGATDFRFNVCTGVVDEDTAGTRRDEGTL